MFQAERDRTEQEINERVKLIKMVIEQMESGLITYTEMTHHLIEGSYFINGKCASIGAMAMHWKVK